MNKRVEALREKMTLNHIDGIIILNGHNSRYLSGFSGSSCYLYISKSRQVLLTDFRYMEQASVECRDYEVIDYLKIGLKETVDRLCQSDSIKALGIEEHLITVREYSYFKEALSQITFHSIEGFVEDLRMVKDQDELSKVKKAANLADQAFSHIIPYLKEGVRELDIALEIEFFMRKNGARELSFETIVASGLRSSMPHGVASDKVIESGDFVTLDFGCVYDSYCSDMTRTVVIGKASERQRQVYNTVLKAQEMALEYIKADLTGNEVDQIARDYIYNQGYGGGVSVMV